jgi:hypothetical protein
MKWPEKDNSETKFLLFSTRIFKENILSYTKITSSWPHDTHTPECTRDTTEPVYKYLPSPFSHSPGAEDSSLYAQAQVTWGSIQRDRIDPFFLPPECHQERIMRSFRIFLQAILSKISSNACPHEILKLIRRWYHSYYCLFFPITSNRRQYVGFANYQHQSRTPLIHNKFC